MRIRAAEDSDHDAITGLLDRAFKGPVESAIVRQLRADNADTLELVAEDHGRIVGQIMFSPAHGAHAGLPVSFGLALGPLAVDPAVQLRGIGTALAEAGLDYVANLGAPWCMLLGDPKYYSRFGFVLAADQNWYWNKDMDRQFTADLQVKPLGEHTLPQAALDMGFHTAFDLADEATSGE